MPIPWLPKPKYASLSQQRGETKVTVLENGLTVATEDKFGQFCTVGVVIDSGSRYEVDFPSGITHFLEKLAYSSTEDIPDKDKFMQILEELSGISDCQGSRDTLIYGLSADPKGLSKLVQLLSAVTLRPLITDEEIFIARRTIEFELESLDMAPDPQPILLEMIHRAAYFDNTLGLPKTCPTENINKINKQTIYEYMKLCHTPDRMVIAGVGINHDELVKEARKHFMSKPIWDDVKTSRRLDKGLAQYTGGEEKVFKDMSNVSLGPTPMPELLHFVIGLESCSHKDKDFIAFCVLNTLMGGGGSFSAGGPGKGMYSRLYTRVLNRQHFMYNATAYNHSYNDSGLFCIHASAPPSYGKEMVAVIVKELSILQNGISEDELQRAKTQLQSMLLMNLESRPVIFEDLGRQMLVSEERRGPDYYFNEIGAIRNEDIIRVAKRMLATPVTIASLGDVNKIPSINDIRTGLSSRDGRLPGRFRLFQ
ncbi:DgyrCDS7710 [Dimorphilus gyrociliatus]|uniref:Mitochondrial-processing peptidase subunit alpha n=1 Tax=Dimorphilus gyrociliatus TaxID=2664684 RepID=A0A7I8VUF6_9ANNE|nr:DgyrCDS7710 [Dimorphilus gyrociliatus]